MHSYYSIESGHKKRHNWLLVIANVFILAGVLFGFRSLSSSTSPAQVSNPISSSPVIESNEGVQQTKLNLPIKWPAYGHAAYGVANKGAVSSKDTSEPVPVASLAKVITALAIMKEKPLTLGDNGPLITFTREDTISYHEYYQKGGAVVPVTEGMQLSQHQAMQAMLMTSANNISDSLAIWAFGSIENYNTYANKMVREMGLSNTVVEDASGFSPKTMSTAEDMTVLGIAYMSNPVLRKISTDPNATIPHAGLIPNYNAAVNEEGIVGIKIGFTDEAGRCFMVASISKQDNQTINGPTVAVVLGANDLLTAMEDAKSLLKDGNELYAEAAH